MVLAFLIVAGTVALGVMLDWALWYRWMLAIEPYPYEPGRQNWRRDLFPRVVLLVLGAGCVAADGFVSQLWVSLSGQAIYLLGHLWGVVQIYRRVQ